MKFFPRTNDLFDTVLDDMFTSPIFSTRNDMAMKTDITEKDGKYLLDMELPGCKKEGQPALLCLFLSFVFILPDTERPSTARWPFAASFSGLFLIIRHEAAERQTCSGSTENR